VGRNGPHCGKRRTSQAAEAEPQDATGARNKTPFRAPFTATLTRSSHTDIATHCRPNSSERALPTNPASPPPITRYRVRLGRGLSMAQWAEMLGSTSAWGVALEAIEGGRAARQLAGAPDFRVAAAYAAAASAAGTDCTRSAARLTCSAPAGHLSASCR